MAKEAADTIELLQAELDRLKDANDVLENDLINANMNLYRMTEKVELLEEADMWIPITERLPEAGDDNGECGSENVIVGIRYEYDSDDEPLLSCAGYLLDGEWWTYTEHSCQRVGHEPYAGDRVTHWRPLPEPPKDGQEAGR
jgi:FtsZ-binding cell division protein ZapB